MDKKGILNYFKTGDDFISENSRYKIVDTLGSGGNGIAFLVICVQGFNKGGIFVLKMLYQISSHERSHRFLDEIKFLKTNTHRSLICHYDDGTHRIRDEEYPFIVTNYMRTTLEDEIRKGMPIHKALIYVPQLLASLKCLQDQNAVHRDIKPANIFINEFHAALGDFGLIKILNDQNDNDKETIKNTLYNYYSKGDAMAINYRTPQLVNYARGEAQLNFKSDIFQLGLVFCYMFTGTIPVERCSGFMDDIKITRIGYIKSDKYGRRINGLLRKMISLNEDEIPNIQTLQDSWTSILIDYVSEHKKLCSNFLTF